MAGLQLRPGEEFAVPPSIQAVIVGLRWAAVRPEHELELDVDGSALLYNESGTCLETLCYRHLTSRVCPASALSYICGSSLSLSLCSLAFLPSIHPQSAYISCAKADTVGDGDAQRTEWLTSPALWSLGDNQQTIAQLGSIPGRVRVIVFAVTMASCWQHLAMLRSVCCRLLDRGGSGSGDGDGDGGGGDGPTELCRFTLDCAPLRKRNAVLLAKLERCNNAGDSRQRWCFVAMGKAVHGSTVAQAAAAAAAFAITGAKVAPFVPLSPTYGMPVIRARPDSPFSGTSAADDPSTQPSSSEAPSMASTVASREVAPTLQQQQTKKNDHECVVS